MCPPFVEDPEDPAREESLDGVREVCALGGEPGLVASMGGNKLLLLFGALGSGPGVGADRTMDAVADVSFSRP